MKTGKVFLGVLAGLATGAMLGILFAPDKGTRTRRRIVHKGEDVLDSMEERFDDFLEKVSEKVDQTIRTTDHLVAKANGKYEDVRDTIKKEVKNNLG